MRFSLGVNYWPRRSAMAMWRRFDAGEIRDDFGHIAALGLDTVRFFLRWDEFQPAPDDVDAGMLDRLEKMAGMAADAGLQTIPTLLCGYMSGMNWLPPWSVDRNARGAGDVFGGKLLDAEVRLVR
ncbi:MAG: beta-galactosidase, partial [Candidatus Velthaea sp.]